MNRIFTIYSCCLGIKGGRYPEITPIKAAKKVAKKLFSKKKNSKIYFCIRETTKNSKKKLFNYIAIIKEYKIEVRTYNKKIQKGGFNITNDIFHLKDNDKYLKIKQNNVDYTEDNSEATKFKASLSPNPETDIYLIYIDNISSQEKNALHYDTENKIYTLTTNGHSLFEFELNERKIYNIFSGGSLDVELINETVFDKRQEARVELCNYMVNFVLHCGDTLKEKDGGRIEIGISNGKFIEGLNSYTKEILQEEYKKLFNIFHIKCVKSNGNIKFTLDYIFLMKDKNNNIEQGGNIMYSIIQGIKMGIILLTTTKYNFKKYILYVDTPLPPTISYFKKTEGLRKALSNIEMTLEPCVDNKHYYWNFFGDTDANTLRFEGNGIYPLIIYKGHLFIAKSNIALSIANHVISLILKKILDDTLSTHDILVQTVFKSLEIEINSNNLTITMTYNLAFMKIDIFDYVIMRLFIECKKPKYDKITTINNKDLKLEE